MVASGAKVINFAPHDGPALTAQASYHRDVGRTDDLVTIFLCGDVMPGRGLDQVLPHPSDPELREPSVKDARIYVQLAESVNGPIPRQAGYDWPWGSALSTLDRVTPDVRVINLESSITANGTFAEDKRIHYRMNPANVAFIESARPDVCVLANNHVLDFGRAGLADTLSALSGAGLRWAGAGHDFTQASRPVPVPLPSRRRVVVVACATTSSGVPPEWAATPRQAGVYFLPDLSDATAQALMDRLRPVLAPGDIVIVSIHWGSNWGYQVPPAQVRFAHRLIDAGVHIVHGHSSHHPRPIERYRTGLVIYGCGDFIDDYEGIAGHERYRDDLRLLYFPTVRAETGAVTEVRMEVAQARRMRLRPASSQDIAWTHGVLARISLPFRTRIELDARGTLSARPAS